MRSRPFGGVKGVPSILSICVWLAALMPAAAQDKFPSRPIKLIVPFSAGGSLDVAARLMGEDMSKQLGSPIVVENRVGAGGNLGVQAAIASPADGYTLVLSGLPMITSVLTSPDASYDMVKNLMPVCGAVAVEAIMVTAKSSGIDSIEALKKRIAAGTWTTYGTQGIYTPGHFMGAWFAHVSGGKAEAVHYRGGTGFVTDVLSGTITFVSATLPVVASMKDRLNVLATLASKRLPQMPDAPTMVEAKLPEYMAVDWSLWTAIYAPANTPKAIVDRLYVACNAALGSPKLKVALDPYAMEPLLDFAPDRMAAFQNEQFGKWKALIEKLGLTKN